jgi:hypothetical protein
MLFDSEPPKPRTGIRKYIPLPLLIILIVAAIVIAYFELHNLPEEHAVEHFFASLEKGNYQEAYKLWEPAPSYAFQDFMHDWGPKGDYGKITQFKILDTESKGSDLVIVTVQINNQSPPLDLVVTRQSKGLAYSPF